MVHVSSLIGQILKIVGITSAIKKYRWKRLLHHGEDSSNSFAKVSSVTGAEKQIIELYLKRNGKPHTNAAFFKREIISFGSMAAKMPIYTSVGWDIYFFDDADYVAFQLLR